MPTPRVYFGAAVVGGTIYAIGGYSGSTLAKVEAYDPVADSWSARASMPTPRARLVVAAVGGKVYAIGGYHVTTGAASYANEEYDPATDTWTPRAELPRDPPLLGWRNSSIGGAALGGKVFVVVWSVSLPELSATYAYDPASDTWTTTASPVPFTRTKYAAASLNGKLYVLAAGDAPDGGPFTTGAPLAVYDPLVDEWVVRPPTSSIRRAQGLVAAGGGLYAIGGVAVDHVEPEETFFTPLATVESFAPSTRRWLPAAAMPTPRHDPAVAAVAGKLYVLGGGLTASNHSLDSPTVPLDTVEEGDLHPAPGACAPADATLCVDDLPGDRRFQVDVTFATAQAGGLSGHGHAVPLDGLGVHSGGLFWFFAPSNPEMLVKVLNGCGVNERYWVFLAAGTNVGLTVRVRDTVSGRTWQREHPDSTPLPTVQDTAAMPCG
jgi:N-acetylneuraminic acid mutarotase